MPAKNPIYFRIIFYDDDARTCGISGIISDDTEVIKRTCALQKAEKNVRIQTAGNPVKDIDMVPSVTELTTRLPEGYSYDPQLKW